MVSTDTLITDVLQTLVAERARVAGRLDAIDLAVANLALVFPPVPLVAKVTRSAKRRRFKAGSRAAKPQRASKATKKPGADALSAAVRRDVVLEAICKSAVGLTVSELRGLTPKMDGQARSNALQQLKQTGQIQRAGNTWVKAA